MKIDDYEMPDELHYHLEHAWARKEGDCITIGFDDFAQKMAGTIKRIALLDEGDEVQQGKPCGTISSGKWTGKLYSPVSGEITEVNEDVVDEPKMINDDPYGEGWLFKVEPSNAGELENLFKGESMQNWLKEEIVKHKK